MRAAVSRKEKRDQQANLLETSLCFAWRSLETANDRMARRLWHLNILSGNGANGQRSETWRKSEQKTSARNSPPGTQKRWSLFVLSSAGLRKQLDVNVKLLLPRIDPGCWDAIVASSLWNKLGWVTASDFLWWGRKEKRRRWSRWLKKEKTNRNGRITRKKHKQPQIRRVDAAFLSRHTATVWKYFRN